MSREDMESDEWGTCPRDDCDADANCNEYDPDEDTYLLICEAGHREWVTTSDETWK